MLSGVLQAFRQFDRDATGGGGKPATAAKYPKARLEAAQILIAAMRTQDAAIRATSRSNLTRLVGQDLGDDPDVWQQWWQQQSAAEKQG
jgi:hypothetical protein